jgi:tripeptide aminopeptidase
MIRHFLEMVTIDSESGHEENMITYLEKYLAQELGAECRVDDYGNLVAKWPGKNSTAEPILLACHADTVKPGRGIRPVVEGDVIRSSGDTILGADDKAGIAEVVEAIRTAPVHPPLEFAVTRQEEVGLLGVKNLDYSLLTAREGYLLDSDVLDAVVIGGPSYVSIDVTVRGRAAHAGMEPEKGISAIRAAALAIARLPLGRLDAATTANVGTISGGIVRNGVPAETSFAAECRSLDHDKAVALARDMERIIHEEVESAGAKAEVVVDVLCEAVEIPAESPVVKTCFTALRSIGLEPRTQMITGFTDASIYNNKGIATAVLGIGAYNEHSTDEYIHISDMEKVVRVLHKIFELKA